MNTLNPEIDADSEETAEWVESLDAVVEQRGRQRAAFLLRRLLERGQRKGVTRELPLTTDFVNTIPVEEEPRFPGDLALEARIDRIVRWNAAVMVHRANARFAGLGGHLSSYASSSTLYEVGLNHFFRGKEGAGSGDQIYYQGHASPGMYARSFLEGRISTAMLDAFRRETVRGKGLSSYPHPRLMPSYWEFPTVSMGLGPLAAVYQARLNRYLHARGIADTSGSRVWAFLGDGETDEPEALAGLTLAARERLDNLVFVINCNLQRLDGPVRGNGAIVQELEGVFRGSGWNVIKVLWGPEWDPLLLADVDGLLRLRLNQIVDGEWQRLSTATGDVVRRDLFGADPRLLELVSHLSDAEIAGLGRGGHSPTKVYAAYQRAVSTKDRPSVILALTIKGFQLGSGFQGANVAHQKKKFEDGELLAFRDTLELPISDADVHEMAYYHPGMQSPEVEYLLERRRALAGCLPARRALSGVQIRLPQRSVYEEFHKGMAKGEASTTMVFSRLLSKLLRDKELGPRVVPIIPDEARTFGMEALFGQVGIYASSGQLYEPVDKGKMLYYRETKNGQVLQEGINEAGALASFVAAGTSYSVHGQPLVPFYVFYSMFGFQRTGDQIWAAGDSMTRGFLLGATAGRTTLNGEGLQHEDGHSHLLASAFPAIVAYDVAFAFELAVIVEHGLKRMLEEDERVVFYITLQNENYPMPPMPEGAEDGIRKGLYRYRAADQRAERHVELLGSACIMNDVLSAQSLLKEHFGVSADVWGVTSYQQLRLDALAVERRNRLHPEREPEVSYLERTLGGLHGPFIAASDYVKTVPDQIARFLPGRLVVLGTDGYGMSDTRDALRRHFEVDAGSIVVAALDALRAEGKAEGRDIQRAIELFDINPEKLDPLQL